MTMRHFKRPLVLTVVVLLSIFATLGSTREASVASGTPRPDECHCENPKACCGTDSKECCNEESPCCRNEGETSGKCCNEETMACCGDGYGCAMPCQSQFDAVPCGNNTPVAATNVNDHEDSRESECNNYKSAVDVCPTLPAGLNTGTLYRAIRPDENCQGGLIAKDPAASKTVSSHVGCGSRQGYKSQFISFSTSYNVVCNKYWPRASPGARLVKVDIETQVVPKDCKILDLTKPEILNQYLGHNQRAKNYAKSDCEVLLYCGTTRVRCKTMLGPKPADEDDAIANKAAGSKTTEL